MTCLTLLLLALRSSAEREARAEKAMGVRKQVHEN